MSDKVYAVYSIPKSPEYRLERLFKSKESAKKYILKQKEGEKNDGQQSWCNMPRRNEIFDIQIEEVFD